MPVQPIRVEYTSSGSAITFGSTFDVFSTGARNVNWDSDDSTLGKVAGVLGLEASLNLDYNFDLDAFWEVSIGENELDLWYDIFLAYDENATVADGESYVLDTGSWFVQDMALSDVGTTNKGSIEAGLEYDVLLDLNEAEVSALGGTASFAPDDPLINIVDARSLLIGGSIEDGQVDFYGAIGDRFLSGREYETEGEYDITAVPGASITWDFDNDLTVENTISGTEDILATGRDLTWQNFSFTQESKDNDNFIGLNFDLDAILQTLGLLPPNPLSPNPLTSVFDYSYDGKFLWREVGLAVELLDIDLNLGLELERIVSFDQTSGDVQILSDGKVVGSGTLGSQVAFAPDVSLGESQDYEIVASVSGTYTQSYGISINLTPIIQVLRAEIGLGRTILDYNDTNELVSTVPDPLFEYDGVDLVELLKELEIIESNDLFSSGFIEVYSVENEIMLTSDGSDDFSITAIDGSRSLEEPPEISEVANAGNASAGFELVGIDVNSPDYNPEERSGAQTYFVDGIFQSKQIYSENGTAWVQAGGNYPRLAFLYFRGDDGFDFIQSLGDIELVNDALLSLVQDGSYNITGYGSSSYRTISFQHYTNAYNPGSDAPVENININGSDLGDTIFYYGGSQYFGGGGLDGFAANWRDQSEGVSWSLVTNDTTTLANGVTVGEFELVHLLLGSGNDAVTGGDSFDYLDGGAGDDILAGGRGSDVLIGGEGNDVIEGGSGRDTIDGGAGDDVILDTNGGSASGGAGNDRFYIQEVAGDTTIDGGSGTDTAWIVGDGGFGENGVRLAAGDHLLYSASNTDVTDYLLDLASGAEDYTLVGRLFNGLTIDVTLANLEAINVDGADDRDLIVYSNGTQYFGGSESGDRFAANWRDQSTAINWSLATTNATTLANGVTVGGFERAHLLLGSGNDAVTGGSDNDYLDGGAGNDTLAGGGGNDVLIGGVGNDVIEGGSGTDTIEGDAGNDVILDTDGGAAYGGGGDDRFYIHDTNNNATIDGGSGTDTAWIVGDGSYSENGVRLAAGGYLRYSANNTLVTDYLVDLASGAEDYTLVGRYFNGRTVDTRLIDLEEINIDGGGSRDLVVHYNGTQYFDSGSGTGDRFAANWRDQSTAINWSLATTNATTLANGVTVGGFERAHLLLGSGNDAVTGGSDNDYLDGGASNDTLAGGGGNDVLIGGAGNDVIEGGAGADSAIFSGAFGVDLVYNSSGTLTAEFEDTAFSALSFSQSEGHLLIQVDGTENRAILINYFASPDSWVVSLNGSTQTIIPAPIAEGSLPFEVAPLLGTISNDQITLTATDTAVQAGNGNDVVVSGSVSHKIDGGNGQDLIDYSASAQGVKVNLETGSGSAGDATGDTYVSIENVIASSNADSIIGSDADNFVSGESGNDFISGADGSDVLFGAEGNDYIYGGEFELRYALSEANQVFRLYQATFNRAPDETGHKRWTSDLFTGEATLADVREGFVGSQEFRNKYAAVDDATFVKQMYINVLDRDFDQGEVTQTEIDNWTNRITDSFTRADVVNGFSESQQLINNTNQTANKLAVNGNPASWSDDVYRLYQATLDRAPDNGGFANWSERLSEGRALIEVISGFTNSQEFANTYGTLSDPEDFVKLLYNNVLGRDFDAGEVAQEEVTGWTSQLSDNFTRAHIVQGFSQSQEFRNNTAQDLKDWIRSQGVEDIIDGGSGDNVLSGGAMADTFLFDQEDEGTHTVLDLEAWDYVDLNGFGYASVADARAHMTQSGSAIQFADQGTVITFERATLVELGDDVFLV